MKGRVALPFVCLVAVQCGSQTPISPIGPTAASQVLSLQSDPVATASLPVSSALPEIFVGAGDVAMCDGNSEITARLLDGIGGTVFALGDNAYMSGTREEFRNCYDPSWGRHRSRTRPVPGNHEYQSSGASPYFEYFGATAGPPGIGYYSFDLGAWHVVALNSNISMERGSAQVSWLRRDLVSNRARCTIAYWHHPLFSSGPNGDSPQVRELWRALYETNAEIVLTAHQHLYERFAPQDPSGGPDPVHGIRQFIVGTGGARLYQPVSVHENSEVRISTFGVLKLTLRGDGYDWEFIPVSGPADSGTGTCH